MAQLSLMVSLKKYLRGLFCDKWDDNMEKLAHLKKRCLVGGFEMVNNGKKWPSLLMLTNYCMVKLAYKPGMWI